MPEISIIVPVYNAEKFLGRCIGSLYRQTLQDVEFILVDDGSCDGSGIICDESALCDSRIKVIHKNNGGVSSARNAGLDVARGEYVMFLDSDDSLVDYTCKVLFELQRCKEYDCIVFGIRQDNGNVWAPEREVDYNSIDEFRDDFVYWFDSELLSIPWNKIYKRKLITKRFLETVSFGEDLIFCLDYIKGCSSISFISRELYLHNNLNECSMTHTFCFKRIFDIECWQKSVLDFAIESNNDIVLYRKYMNDILHYMVGLYGCCTISFIDKKCLLKYWYPKSYLRRLDKYDVRRLTHRFILFCLRRRLWCIPQLAVDLKRFFKYVCG